MKQTIKLPVVISAIVIVIVATAVAWFFINYKFTNGQLVKTSVLEYAELERGFDASYEQGDLDAQLQFAQLMKNSGIDDRRADLLMAEALLGKGSLEYYEEANADEALALLMPLLNDDPTNPEILSTIGYAYEIKQDYARALDYYDQSLKFDSEDEILYLRRGHAYDLMGNLRLAEVDYVKAHEINDQNESVKINLARLYYRSQNTEGAFKYASELMITGKNLYIKAEASDLIGVMAIADEDYDQAFEYFDYAISTYPDYPNAYLNYAYASILKTETVKTAEEKNILLSYAEDDIGIALDMHPDSSFAVVLQGLIADVRGDSKAAKELYAKGLALVDGDISLGKIEKDAMKAQINSLLKK